MEIIHHSSNTIEAQRNGYWKYSGDNNDGDTEAYCGETKGRKDRVMESSCSTSKIIQHSKPTQQFFYQPSHIGNSKLLTKTADQSVFYDKTVELSDTGMDAIGLSVNDAISSKATSRDLFEPIGCKDENEDQEIFVVSELSDDDNNNDCYDAKNDDRNDKSLNFLPIENDVTRNASSDSFSLNPNLLFVLPNVIPRSPRQPSKMLPPKHRARIRDLDTKVYHVKVVDINLDEENIDDRDNFCVNKSNNKNERIRSNHEKQINEIMGLISETTKITEKGLDHQIMLNDALDKEVSVGDIVEEKTEACPIAFYGNNENNFRLTLEETTEQKKVPVKETEFYNDNRSSLHPLRLTRAETAEHSKNNETKTDFYNENRSSLDSPRLTQEEKIEQNKINELRTDLDKLIDVGSLKQNNIENETYLIKESFTDKNLNNNYLECAINDNTVVSSAEKHSRLLVSTNQAKESEVFSPNKSDHHKGLSKVTVTQQYIEPKKNIQTTGDFLRVPPTGYSESDDTSDGQEKEEEEKIQSPVKGFTRRRRSLSEGDLFFTIRKPYFVGKTESEEASCELISHSQRKHSLSCGDLLPSYEEDSFESDTGESSYEEEEEEYDGDTSDDDEDIVPYCSDSSDSERRSITKVDSPSIQKPRRKVAKKKSFIAKSISVDLLPQHDRYFSNIRNRRNGLINPIEAKIREEENNDFIADLIEFKKAYKKPKKGLRIAKSVESFFDKSSSSYPIARKIESSSSIAGKSKKRRFLSGLFTRNEKMEYLRETSILDDYDAEVSEINDRPKISIVEDSIKKVAGVIELYIDSHGDVIRKIEITKVPGQSLGFFIRFGNGIDRSDGIFISRVTLGSFVDENNLMHSGDEILSVNKVDVTGHSLETVAAMMQSTQRLIITTKSALPLPINTNPLLRTYGRKQSELMLTHPEFSTSMFEKLKNYDGKPCEIAGIQRTKSDPDQLNETSSDINDSVQSFPDSKRDRSRSMINGTQTMAEIKLVRGLKYQQDQSLVSTTKLKPHQHSSEDLSQNNKSFSRAQQYQFRKSPTRDIEKRRSTCESLVVPTSKNPLHSIKSPKLFRREHKKQTSAGSMSSTLSNESLSSTSDSEDTTYNNHLQVYPSDSTTIVSPLKSFTGKLVVSIYKLIGRLSGIDGECYCTIEIDGEFKATTQVRRVKELVTVDEKFEIDLQKGSVLMFFLFHKQGKKKQHKLVSQSCIHLENLLSTDSTKKTLLLGTSNRVQMRIKINFTGAESYLQRSPSLRKNGVFGFNLSKTLAKEENTIPIIVRKCVEEIEKRGLELTGIYRICGNARKKKQLRAQFEENSHKVDVSNEDVVDCHVLAGILKDYLRELPNPLISNEMYQNIYNKAHVKNKDQNNLLGDLMKKLPYANRATLIYIMDHLKRVAAFSETNKMTNQNLAVCFGPVMMFSSYNLGDMLDFKKQIDALEFLLNIWPVDVEHQNGI